MVLNSDSDTRHGSILQFVSEIAANFEQSLPGSFFKSFSEPDSVNQCRLQPCISASNFQSSMNRRTTLYQVSCQGLASQGQKRGSMKSTSVFRTQRPGLSPQPPFCLREALHFSGSGQPSLRFGSLTIWPVRLRSEPALSEAERDRLRLGGCLKSSLCKARFPYLSHRYSVLQA